MNTEILNRYKLIRNNVELTNVELELIESRKGKFKDDLSLSIKRGVKLTSDDNAEIYLATSLEDGHEEDATFINVVFKGICKSLGEIKGEEFKKYTYEQIVPLLLPYAREIISNTMVRMKLPIFVIPTMDVLESIRENDIQD